MITQGGETVDQDNVNGWIQVAKLQARFPGFTFRLIRGRDDENRIEAVRKAGSEDDGLYALISTDPAEVAAELKRAA